MRKFDAQSYLDKKTAAINEFFTNAGLNSVVVGISGGVDSAVALLLFYHAAMEPGSPIQKIRALKMPIYGNGVTGQDTTIDKAHLLMAITNDMSVINASHGFNPVEWRHCDLTMAYEEMIVQAVPIGHEDPNAWSNGQMASVLRTPMFYYQAALLQQDGYKSVVSGTTNRDEGSYIGFFGKGSDGMVDIQPIADLHKSEVYKLAELLGVPKAITGDAPRGDVWDSKTDEEMIGAPYVFLQKMIEHKCTVYRDYKQDLDMAERIWQRWLDTRKGNEKTWADNIEKLHNTNKHKYMVGSPAHFIDVQERCVPGGWESIEYIIEKYREFAWQNGLTINEKNKFLTGVTEVDELFSAGVPKDKLI